MENNKNKKSVNFQGDMLNFCDFIQVFVFTTNHHLNSFPLEHVSRVIYFGTDNLPQQNTINTLIKSG